MAKSKKAPKKKAAKSPAKKTTPKKTQSKMKTKSAAKSVKAKKSATKPAVAKFNAKLITPLEDRLLVTVEGLSEKTAGGIIIPGSVNERPNRGTVMASGRGRRNKKGNVRPLDVEVGDTVLFADYAGTKIEVAGQEMLILREEDVLGIVT